MQSICTFSLCLKSLIEFFSSRACGTSTELVLDGHYVALYSNTSEFASVLVHEGEHAYSDILTQFSFFPAEKTLFVGACRREADGQVLVNAFREAIPDVVIKDGRSTLQSFAKAHELEEWKDECAVGFFSPARIDSRCLPDGLYQYDLRDSDEDETFPASVESKVTVDHYGTIVVCAPLPAPIAMSVPFIPYDEDGNIAFRHSLYGEPRPLGSLQVGDRFHKDDVSASEPAGVNKMILDPYYPNLTITSIEQGQVMARDAFGGIHCFPAERRVWRIPEILSEIS